MTCTNCKLVRLKKPDIFHTQNDEAGNIFDSNALPTVPLNPPTSVGVGHTLQEQYDNGFIWWHWDGTAWVIDSFWTFPNAANLSTHNDEPGNTIDINVLPTAPLNPPTNPSTGDTLIEGYDNGNAYWTYDGVNWVLDFVQIDDDGIHTQNDESGNVIDFNTLPTTPINSPTNPTIGDTLHEYYDNGSIYWTYDGANWVIDFAIPLGNKSTHINSVGNVLDENTAPTAPVSSPTNPATGDTIIEAYDNGTAYWTYDGTTWVLDFYALDKEYCCTYIVESDPYDCANPPTTPTNPPVTANIGDTLIEKYNRVVMYWEYDGANWVLVTQDVKQNFHYRVNNTAVDLNNLPTAPNTFANDTLTYSTKDLLIEFYTNIALIWRFKCGTGWIQVGTLDTGSPKNGVGQATNNYDCANPPTAPESPPTVASNGDTYIELFDRVVIYWQHDGITWNVLSIHEMIDTFYDDQTAIPVPAPLTTPTSFTADTTVYVTGDLLFERYSDGTVIWRFDCANGWEVLLSNTSSVTNNTDVVQVATLYDCATPPTTPDTIPTTANTNDTLIEIYDRVTLYWHYDGAAWVLDATELHNQDYHVDVAPNLLTNGIAPLTPITPGATTDYIDGDTLYELYTNGYAQWTYTGCVWVLDYYRVSTDGFTMTFGNETGYDCNAHPTAPVNAPVAPNANDVYVEFYENGTREHAVTITWLFDGATWIEQGVTYNNRTFHYVDDTASIDVEGYVNGTAHITPIAPGATTDYINGDTLIEILGGDKIYWTYDVCAWVRDGATLCHCFDDYITPIITVDTQDICINGTVNFTDASIQHSDLTNLCTYQDSTWDFGDGSATVTGQNVSHSFTSAGLYFVTLTTTCTSGATAMQQIAIKVTDVIAEFETSTTTPSVNVPFTLNNLTNAYGCNASYLWDFGDGNTSTVSEPGTYTYTVDGNYTITLTVTCDTGCTDTYTQAITVSSTPTITAEFTIADDTLSVNNGDSTALTDTTTSNCSHDAWVWEVSIDGGAFTQFSTAQNPTYTPTVGGIHTVRLTATCTGAGISDSVTHDIAVTELNAAFTVSAPAVDTGDDVTLTDTSTSVQCPGATLQWAVSINGGAYTDIGTTTPFTYATTVDGTYDFRLTVTCPDGTTDNTTQTVTASAVCAGTETCYQECTPSGQFADWGTTTAWDAGNEDFSDSVVRNQVIRDGARVSPLTNIANTGINGTITGDGTVKTTNNGVNLTSGSLVLRILADGSGDQRSILMTFDQPVDVSFQLDAMRLGQTANIAGDGIFNYIPYSDGTPQVTTITGDGTNNINLTTPVPDTTNRSGYVCGSNLNQFRFDFTTAGTGGTVVNLYFTISLQPAAASQQWKVCDDGGTLTFTDLSNIGNPLPTAVGLDWAVITCP